MLKKYWFMTGMGLIFAVTLVDATGVISGAGLFLQDNRGPEGIVFSIFLLSGLVLNAGQIRAGVKDIKVLLASPVIIFIISPVCAALAGLYIGDAGIRTGLFLVAVMPTTLSSGVVMTGAAGGNMATALLVTLTANSLAVVTVPATLSILLSLTGQQAVIHLDVQAVMVKIALCVILPLCIGLVLKLMFGPFFSSKDQAMMRINQVMVLCMVWIGMSQCRTELITRWYSLGIIIPVVVGFHCLLWVAAWGAIKLFDIPSGHRECLIFLGGQKTLPLSVMIQGMCFPQYNLALLFCVMHHMIHLIMDAWLLQKIVSVNKTEKP